MTVIPNRGPKWTNKFLVREAPFCWSHRLFRPYSRTFPTIYDSTGELAKYTPARDLLKTRLFLPLWRHKGGLLRETGPTPALTCRNTHMELKIDWSAISAAERGLK